MCIYIYIERERDYMYTIYIYIHIYIYIYIYVIADPGLHDGGYAARVRRQHLQDQRPGGVDPYYVIINVFICIGKCITTLIIDRLLALCLLLLIYDRYYH